MENRVANSVGGSFGISPPGRQHSIYSLTLDEFQNTLGEAGKQFGSMNMDELLKNICTVEESQAMAAGEGSDFACNGLIWQGSLPRQGSLTLPRTLSRKTVDEVWKDIIFLCSGSNPTTGNGSGVLQQQQQTQQQQQQQQTQQQQTQQRQPKTPTFREMTLEEFLMKAGVVREELVNEKQQTVSGCGILAVDYGLGGAKTRTGEKFGEVCNDRSSLGAMYTNPALGLAEGKCNSAQFGARTALSLPMGTLTGSSVASLGPSKPDQVPDWPNRLCAITSSEQVPLQQQSRPTQHQPQEHQRQQLLIKQQTPVTTERGNLFEMGQWAHHWNPGVGMRMKDCHFGGKMDAFNLALGSVSPCSPLSDEQSQDNGYGMSSAGNYVFDGILRGRKRGSELTIDKVIERRQRRMIKNRESAARSRARKQAYTVELEAELTKLKEENYKLRKQKEDVDRKKKQLILELIMDPRARHSRSNSKGLRRTTTGPW